MIIQINGLIIIIIFFWLVTVDFVEASMMVHAKVSSELKPLTI